MVATAKAKLGPDDLDWEEPSISRIGGGFIEELAVQVGEMRSALSARRGSWAVVDTFEKPTKATAVANQLCKKRGKGDSRLLHLEFAGRKMLDGGSKLYVRLAPA